MIARTLPRSLTPLLGRQQEIREIQQMLADPACRMITLLGPGGMGKTRLAIAVAELDTHFADGVCFVSLQPVETVESVPYLIADALNLALSEDAPPLARIQQFLREKQLLLILDNFEHLLAAAEIVSLLITAGPEVKCLVTSREILHLQEEWIYPVRGLAVPREMSFSTAHHDDAVALFIDRAQRVRHDFAPETELAEIVQICRLVEGMPLAVELAAGWVKSLNCAGIVAEIQQGMDILATGLRNVPARHRSMVMVFDQSWEMLSPAEKQVYAHLSLFRGGFRREAAEEIAGANLLLLTGFVDKSLLHWGADGRYHLHELLRQYAAERLPGVEQSDFQERHCAYYIRFLYQRENDICGGQQKKAVQEIQADLDNIVAAWRWAAENGEAQYIEQAITSLAMFYHLQSQYLPAVNTYEFALNFLDEQQPAHRKALALLLSELAWISIRLGRFDQAQTLFVRCRSIYQQQNMLPLPGVGTDPLIGLSTLASIHGQFEQAIILAEQARETAASQNYPWNEANAHYQLADIHYAQGRYEQAMAHATAAYTLTEQNGDRWFRAYALIEMGKAALALGDYTTARQHFEASYNLREELADPEGMAVAMIHLGMVALRRDDVVEAGRLYQRSAAIYREIVDRGGLAIAYHGLAQTSMAEADYPATQEHLRQALDIAAEIQFTSLVLSILATSAEFFLHTGRVEWGITLLALVAQHPAGKHEIKTMVKTRLAQYEAQISPVLYTTANAKGREMTLAPAVDTTQTLLATAIPANISTAIRESLPDPQMLADPLTDREQEVLRLIAQGLTNRQIAEELSVVVGTVKAHNNRIYSKLSVTNRVQALARARELGLIA